MDSLGRLVWGSSLTGASSPTNSDESWAEAMRQLQAMTNSPGGFMSLIRGRPEFAVVHFFDRGYLKLGYNRANRHGCIFFFKNPSLCLRQNYGISLEIWLKILRFSKK